MQCYADYKEGPIPGMHGSDGQSVSNTLVLRAYLYIYKYIIEYHSLALAK